MGNLLSCEAESENQKLRNKIASLESEIIRIKNGRLLKDGGKEKFSMTARGKAIMKTIFDRMDKNHDGRVNIRELIKDLKKDSETAALLHLPMHIHESGGSKATLFQRFSEMDTDGSKDVTFKEFCAYFACHKADYEKFMAQKISDEHKALADLKLQEAAFKTGNAEARILRLAQIFQKLKGSHDYISAKEFQNKKPPQKTGDAKKDKELQESAQKYKEFMAQFCSVADIDHDKLITKSEFIAECRRITAQFSDSQFEMFLNHVSNK